MKKLKTTKASILVFSLIVLFIGVAAAIGIASSTIISQKNSITTASSTQAFQVADSGVEIFLGKFKNAANDDTLDDLGLTCNGAGVITGSIGTGKDFTITALKADGTTITDCNTTTLANLDRIKSIGSYKSTNRAVEVAVAAGGGVLSGTLCGSTFYVPDTSNIQYLAKCDNIEIAPGTDNCPTGYERVHIGYVWLSDAAHTVYMTISCAKK